MDRLPQIRFVEDAGHCPGVLEQYSTLPIAFEVTARFVVQPMEQGLGGLLLVEEALETPYVKDYDAGEPPLRWRDSFDLSHWAVFMAFQYETLIGGSVAAWNTPGLDMLEGRDDIAVLWDLRVHPEYRRCGVGHRLFRVAEDWARGKGCRSLKVETQNINVPACRFYARQGCTLRSIRQDAYREFPEETQLLWYKTL